MELHKRHVPSVFGGLEEAEGAIQNGGYGDRLWEPSFWELSSANGRDRTTLETKKFQLKPIAHRKSKLRLQFQWTPMGGL